MAAAPSSAISLRLEFLQVTREKRSPSVATSGPKSTQLSRITPPKTPSPAAVTEYGSSNFLLLGVERWTMVID